MLVYNGIDLIKRHVSSHFFIFESSPINMTGNANPKYESALFLSVFVSGL